MAAAAAPSHETVPRRKSKPDRANRKCLESRHIGPAILAPWSRRWYATRGLLPRNGKGALHFMDERTNALPVGTELEGYRVVALLGAGGFGITYKAVDLLLDRHVAIKEYLPSVLA